MVEVLDKEGHINVNEHPDRSPTHGEIIIQNDQWNCVFHHIGLGWPVTPSAVSHCVVDVFPQSNLVLQHHTGELCLSPVNVIWLRTDQLLQLKTAAVRANIVKFKGECHLNSSWKSKQFFKEDYENSSDYHQSLGWLEKSCWCYIRNSCCTLIFSPLTLMSMNHQEEIRHRPHLCKHRLD